MTQTLNCSYNTSDWWKFKNIYTCRVENVKISSNSNLKLIGEHQNGKINDDVEGIRFSNCEITIVPQGLTRIFPNLKILFMYDSKMKFVKRDDLKEYSKIMYLSFLKNKIEYLPGDLLADMMNLEYVSFVSNKLQIIEPNLLNGLDKLEFVSFWLNICTNICYDKLSIVNTPSLDEIKNEIRVKFSTLTPTLREKYGKIKIDENLQQNMINSSQMRNTGDNSMISDLQKVIQNQKLKDFTIYVGHEEFEVHKFLLAARSPVFAEMIENNIDAECLNLTDISSDIFRGILKFIYTDQSPHFDIINFEHLFIAAGRLKIENLKNFAAEKIQVTSENAIEMLTLANKYESEILRQKSVEEIKKNLGISSLDDELAKTPDKIERLIEMKRKKDEHEEMMKSIDAEFNSLLFNASN